MVGLDDPQGLPTGEDRRTARRRLLNRVTNRDARGPHADTLPRCGDAPVRLDRGSRRCRPPAALAEVVVRQPARDRRASLAQAAQECGRGWRSARPRRGRYSATRSAEDFAFTAHAVGKPELRGRWKRGVSLVKARSVRRSASSTRAQSPRGQEGWSRCREPRRGVRQTSHPSTGWARRPGAALASSRLTRPRSVSERGRTTRRWAGGARPARQRLGPASGKPTRGWKRSQAIDPTVDDDRRRSTLTTPAETEIVFPAATCSRSSSTPRGRPANTAAAAGIGHEIGHGSTTRAPSTTPTAPHRLVGRRRPRRVRAAAKRVASTTRDPAGS